MNCPNCGKVVEERLSDKEAETRKLVNDLIELALEWKQKDCAFSDPSARYVELRTRAQALGYGPSTASQTMKDKTLHWFGTGRVGASSKAMALHLCGAQCDGSYPHDPEDLNRCLLFLEAVPEARVALPRMATLNKKWAALVDRWAEIEASFLAEVGRDWCKAKYAPNTYMLMREIIDSVMK